MPRRIASIWLPRFETDLIARREPRWRDAPLALYLESGQRLTVVAVNAPAEAEGVRPGMTLADARALTADLATRPHAPERRARSLQALVRWLDRFAPLVAVDGDDGFFLETTGMERLAGPEEAFLARLIHGFERHGLAARAAIADTAGAAWALARHAPRNGEGVVAPPGQTRAALAPLPVASLRLPAGVAERLARLGLARVDDLYALPRASLTRRFGVQTVTRLDQALGAAPEPISPVRAPTPYTANLAFAEPLLERGGIEIALARLLEKLATRLALDERGARTLDFQIERVDGGRQTVSVGAAEATRDTARLARLFAEKLGALDPGFGVEAARLTAPWTEPVAPGQADALDGQAPPQALSGLIDALGARLGFDAIRRFAPQDRWQPDRDYRLVPAAAAVAAARATGETWPSPPGPRPLELLRRPAPVDVESAPGAAGQPDDLAPPRAIWRGGARQAIRHAAGPERIAPEWRETAADWPAPRDYWRAEDETGARLWLYRENAQWFLHGRFP